MGVLLTKFNCMCNFSVAIFIDCFGHTQLRSQALQFLQRSRHRWPSTKGVCGELGRLGKVPGMSVVTCFVMLLSSLAAYDDKYPVSIV